VEPSGRANSVLEQLREDGGLTNLCVLGGRQERERTAFNETPKMLQGFNTIRSLEFLLVATRKFREQFRIVSVPLSKLR
jgi:hypothetical protein